MQTNNQTILPPKTIGIIGGGQLGRMMALAARYMGYKIVVLDPTPNCPTAQIADEQIIAAYNDIEAIQKLMDKSDVVTYEFENVDLQAASLIEKTGKLPQGAFALEITQDRKKEKELIRELGLSVADFEIVENGLECRKVLEEFPLPAVIKTCHGGYDGKGQVKLESRDDFKEAIELAESASPCIIEKWIPFDLEISTVFTRSIVGEIEFFPIAENDHRDQILYKTTVPAKVQSLVTEKAYEAARKLAERMDIVGTFTVEMFVSQDKIYLNEMAPRPHNSGHYTIEACSTSQFTQHIRAICGLRLVPVRLLEPSIMLNILGENMPGVMKAMPKLREGFIHLYGKEEAKTKRKMGHVTFIGETSTNVDDQVATFLELTK